MADQVVGIKINVEGADAGKSVGSLKSQLREAQAEVAVLSEKFGATSDAAINAAKKAAQLKDAIGDAKALTDAFNPDAKFKAFSSAIQGVVGGFGALQGAQALFGAESEDVAKTLAKVQSALLLSQGINSILEAKDSFKNLGSVIKTYVVGAFSSLKSAIITTGLGALVIALGYVIDAFMNIQSAADKAAEAQKNLNEQTQKYAEVGLKAEIESLKNREKLEIARAKAAGATEEEIFAIQQNYREQNKRALQRNYEETKGIDAKNDTDKKSSIKSAQTDIEVAELEHQANLNKIKNDAAIEAKKKEEERLKALREERKKYNEEALALQQELIIDARNIGKSEQQVEEEDLKRKYEAQVEILKKGGQQTALAQFVYLEELKKIREKYKTDEVDEAQMTADQIAIVNNSVTGAVIQNTQERIKWSQIEAEERVKFAQDIGNALGVLGDLIGQQTAAGKALAIAQAIINTWTGATEVLRAKSVLPEPIGTISKIANVAAIVATGIKAVKNITATKVPGGGGGGGAAASNLGVSAPVGMAPSNTLLNQQLINQQGNAAVRSFVLESDVSGNQERIRRLNRAARIN